MRIQDRTNMQRAFNQHSKKIELAGHAENEVEREALVTAADALAAPWQTEEFVGDWQYLRDLREQWREDPDRMRAETATALAGRGRWTEVDEETDRQQSHMSYVQHFWDPREQELQDWREMHDKVSYLHAKMALAENETEIDRIQARVQEMYDQTYWPQSWKEAEAEHNQDYERSMEQSALTSEYYGLIQDHPHDLTTYVPWAAQLDAELEAAAGDEQEIETVELEEAL